MLDNVKPGKKRLAKKPPLLNRLAEPVSEHDGPAEMTFVPPEQIAKQDETNQEIIEDEPIEIDHTAPKRKLSRPKLPKLTKKQWLIILAAVLLIGGAAAAAWTYTHRTPPADNSPASKTVYTPPKPTTVASRLTGVQISPELNDLPTTAFQIENSPDARPQAGLYDAGIVTEAIAEGGITRFNAIYMEAQPDRVGPVRSLRPYYIDFFWPYDAPIVHAGGSGEALAQVRSLNLKDLDHGINGSYFYRDNSRFAPHNLYTSRVKILELQRSKGWGTSSFTGLVRKAEKKSAAPNAHAVDVGISSFLYNPRFDYDASTNSYLRSLAGKPHMDENGKQINPKVVVVLVMPHHYEGIYSVYQTTGSGKAFIFQDGTVVEGIWEKTARNAQFRFGDANGAPIGLNPGQTWMTLATSADKVKITP